MGEGWAPLPLKGSFSHFDNWPGLETSRKPLQNQTLTKRLETEAETQEDSEGHLVLVHLLLPPNFIRRTLVAHKTESLSIVTILIFLSQISNCQGPPDRTQHFQIASFFFFQELVCDELSNNKVPPSPAVQIITDNCDGVPPPWGVTTISSSLSLGCLEQSRLILTSGDIWQCLETVLFCTAGGRGQHCASMGRGQGKLFNIFQHTGQSPPPAPTTKRFPTQNVNSARLRNPGLEQCFAVFNQQLINFV